MAVSGEGGSDGSRICTGISSCMAWRISEKLITVYLYIEVAAHLRVEGAHAFVERVPVPFHDIFDGADDLIRTGKT